MSNALEFILKLQDLLTPGMRQAAAISNTASAQIESQFARVQGSSKRMTASVNELRARLDAVNKVRFSTTLEREFNASTRAAKKLEQQIERLENKGNSKGLGMIGGLISTAAITYGAREVINTGIQQQSIGRAINYTTKGKGTEAMDFIANQSNSLGLDQEAMQVGFKTLSGGLRGLNFDLKQQEEVMSGVNKGIATYGLRGEESNRVYLALGQIASKGTVQAEELRGQIGEVLPGAFSLAARSMGVSEQQLNKLMDTGKLMSNDFLPKFALQMEKEFGQSALDASTGAAASMNRFNNTMLSVKKTISEDVLPPFINFLNELGKGFKWILENKDIFFPIAAGIGAVVIITQGWAVAQGILNSVMAVNPIIALVGFIIFLGVLIYNIVKKYEGWGNSMKGLWEIIKGWVTLNLLVWKEFGETIKYWIDIAWLKIQGFVEWVGGALGNVWNAIKLAAQFKFGEAKVALFAEIKTTTTNQLNEVERSYNAGKLKNQQAALSAIQQMQTGFGMIGLKKKVSAPKGATADSAAGSNAVADPAYNQIGGTVPSKADNINQGGQRSIIINIGKQIEKLEMHVLGAKEGADEMGAIIREELRRTLYSLNGAIN